MELLAPDQDYPLGQPWTVECDGTRSAKRSSTNLAYLNMRFDPAQNTPYGLVNRLMSDFGDEIVAAAGPGCYDSANNPISFDSSDLQIQWTMAKNAVAKWKKKPKKILSEAVRAIDDLTIMALDTIPQCDDNRLATIVSRSMNASYMACSYLGHPKTIVGVGKLGETEYNSCPIRSDIVAIIDPTP